MASAKLTATNSLKTVEWMWQSNSNPWSDEQAAEWSHYSDVENLIIEKAFSNKQQRAELDEYYIDFTDNVQVSNSDSNKKRPVKRIIRKRDDKHLREARFMDLPIASERSFGGQYGFVSPFVIEIRRYLKLDPFDLPSTKPEIIPDLVEKAAKGIIMEGKNIRKQREAEEIASLLREKRNKEIKEVWQRCVYLYSLESFLYKTLNATMRLVGSRENDQVWRSKISTLGPFCLLLWDDPFSTKMKVNVELYRGADLQAEHITMYEKMVNKKDGYGSFQGFSSCSRNREKAEQFGNTLFIMRVKFAFVADLSKWSEYPNEEEELIMPGVCFRVLKIEFDRKKNKNLIYLELKQRWSAEDSAHYQSSTHRSKVNDAYDDDAAFAADGTDAFAETLPIDGFRFDRDGNWIGNK
ncbi:unnamed protein product [Adineta ricciae]|uniref:NAD(P)(+)--arginine ADP-ribosyltransferase n=1 Tax=Adineta ricciae TaxID=249248 RepID=A0A814ST90_ADIRI|nr:unnamed protein product [Adineta ricciae]CAF1148885.1 unnamed protein product [Adineta ricciae]